MVFKRFLLLVFASLLLLAAMSTTSADPAGGRERGGLEDGISAAGIVVDFPEPATVVLLGIGGLVLMPRRVRRGRKRTIA
jgi:hypothetical protein